MVLKTELDRTTGEGNGSYPGGTTFYNLTNGSSGLITVNPNSHFDPTKQLVLNPASWVDAPAGQFGASAPYYNSYRWQRQQPAESMAFARNFRFGKEGKYNLNTRIEFQNVFNRHFYSMPTIAPSTPQANLSGYYQGGPPAGALSAGYGYVSYLNGAGDTPRSGQAVARFTF